MQKLLVVVFLVSLVFNVVSHLLLPDDVAIHFGWGGQPDSWAPKGVDTVLFVTADVIIFLICFFMPILFAKTPKKWINLPNKDFWLSEENIATTRDKLNRLMAIFSSLSQKSLFGRFIHFFGVFANRMGIKQALSSLVGEMLTEIDPFVNGSDDMAIRTEDSEIVLVAIEKQEGYTKTLIEKIQKITQNKLRKKYGHPPILPMLGVAVYPTDSHDMVELEKMARHEIRQMT